VDLRHLRSFIAVAEHLNFRRAAQALDIAQPSLSLQIMTLESDLGVSLFNRDKRNVRLTDAGVVYYAEVRKVFATLATANQRVQEAQFGTRGTLSIGSSGPIILRYLPELISEFRSGFPNVRLRIVTMGGPDSFEAVRNRVVNVALLRVEPTVPDAALSSVPLWEHPFRIALPTLHPLAGQEPVSLSDLGDETLIMYPRSVGSSYDDVLDMCHEAHFVPRGIEEVPEVEAALGLVACGFGVAILPSPWDAIQYPGVAFRPIEASTYRCVKTCAYWHKDEDSKLIGAFVDLARAYVPPA
jgi:DNA-binding transcriptional LysR family regulator